MPCAFVSDGKTLDVSTGYCVCSDYLKCTEVKCYKNYESKGSTSNPICSPVLTCPEQAEGCKTCGLNEAQDAKVCFSCNDGYTLIGSLCIKYTGCSSIDPKTALCTTCSDGYYFNYDFAFNNVTNENWEKYYTVFDGFCSQCSLNCAKCASGTTCIQCKTGFVWTPDTKTKGVGAC